MNYKWIVFNFDDYSIIKKIDDLMSVKLYHGIGKVSVIFKGDEEEYFLTRHETLNDLSEDNNIYRWVMDYCENSNNCRPKFFDGGKDEDDPVGSGVILIPDKVPDQELLQGLFPAHVI